ncbi:MAG TPA: hypothetical protein DEB31_09650, partial [Clostridiales bacterium]|nr:hypothetical protein [Clostridiales bacterium]
MNAFKTDMKRALTSWGFVVGVIGLAVAAFFGVFEQMTPIFQGKMTEGLEPGFTIGLVFSALSSDVVLLVLPILCAIPFTPAFYDDYRNKFYRAYLPRAGNQPYMRAKVLTTVFSGGLTLFLGVMLVLVVFAILFAPMEVTPELPEMNAYELDMYMQSMADTDTVAAQLNFGELMTRSLVFFLSGSLWALVGGILCTVTMSKYMAYASPFILYYVLVILSERYFTSVYVINPQEWLSPTGDWVGGTWGVALLVLELVVILS